MNVKPLPQWAIDRGRMRGNIETLEPAKTALIVVDLQNGFMLPDQVLANPKACAIVPNVNLLVRNVRNAGGLVVFLRHTISDEPRFRLTEWQQRPVPRTPEGDFCFRSGSFAHQLHQDLDVQADDLVVNKHRYSAFLPNSSDLDAMLRERGIDTLIITGTVTNVCCESTARDGNMLGYKIIFVSDATAAVTGEEHNATLLSMAAVFGDVCSVSETLRLLQTA